MSVRVKLSRRSFTTTRRPVFGRALYKGRCKGATFTSPNRYVWHRKDFIGTVVSEPDAQGFVFIDAAMEANK